VSDYLAHLLLILLLWASLALSQGFLTGYLGLLAVHQAAAWGIGAYTAALLNRALGLPLGATLLPGAAAAAAILTGLTYLVARGRRDDQIVASLCIQIIFVALFTNLALTGGANGLANIGWGGPSEQRIRLLACLAAAALLLVGCATLCLWIAKQRNALQWRLIRDDEQFAASLGISTARARIACSALAAAMAGAAGTIFAHYATFIEPQTFGLGQSVAILSIAVLGRSPRIIGVLVATMFVVLMPELLRLVEGVSDYAANLRQAMFGLLLLVAIGLRR
jgi:branched-chain amino acid transport system permease protein